MTHAHATRAEGSDTSSPPGGRGALPGGLLQWRRLSERLRRRSRAEGQDLPTPRGRVVPRLREIQERLCSPRLGPAPIPCGPTGKEGASKGATLRELDPRGSLET